MPMATESPPSQLRLTWRPVAESCMSTKRALALGRLAVSRRRMPASVRDIARTISRTAWRTTIREDEVEDVISTMSEIESVDGKYVLRKRR